MTKYFNVLLIFSPVAILGEFMCNLLLVLYRYLRGYLVAQSHYLSNYLDPGNDGLGSSRAFFRFPARLS
jgi:hypothetical protein